MTVHDIFDLAMNGAERAEPLVDQLTAILNDAIREATADAREAMRTAWKANRTEPLRNILTKWGELDEKGWMHEEPE